MFALSKIRTLLKSTAGNVAMSLGLAAVPVVAIAGAAIDMARVNTAETELLIALDTAVLAAASDYSMANEQNNAAALAAAEAGEEIFHKALAKTGVARNMTVDITFDAAEKSFKAVGTATVETPFMSMVDSDISEISREARARGGAFTPTGNLEVSIVLDTTGSMCNDGYGPCTNSPKMTALKTAAKTLIDTVIWDDQTTYKSRAAVIPFANRVRLAPDGGTSSMFTALTNMPNTWSGWYRTCVSSSGGGGSESSGSWTCHSYQSQYKTNWKVMPCVTDRHYNTGWQFDYTDDAPTSGKYLNGHDGSRSMLSQDSANTPIATSKNGTASNRPATHWNYTATGACADIHNNNTMIPLTSNVTLLKNKVDSLSAFGGTAGTLGTAFGWYTLSPNFASVWGTASAPEPYSRLTEIGPSGKPKLRKVAVIMTDGVYNSYRGWKDQNKTDMSNAAKQMCTNMKAKGIEIYTVGFMLNQLPAVDRAIAESTLQHCGTTLGHFYSTLTGADLVAAFTSIGQKVKSASIGDIRIYR